MKFIRLILSLLFLISVTYSCDNKSSDGKNEIKEKYTVAGEINNTHDSTIVVVAMSGNKITFDTLKLDSCYFNYKGVADSLSKVNIYYAGNEYVTLFVRSKDSVYININAAKHAINQISDGGINELIYSHYADSVRNSGEKAITEFILNNKNNGASVAMLSQTLDSFARPRDISNLLDSISAVYKTEALAYEIKGYSTRKQKLSVGSKMPYLYIKGSDNKKHNVYDNRDYVTLISFWATYDSTSVAKVKALKDINKKFKNRPLRFVNISMDDNDSLWRADVKKYELPGVNARVEKGWSDELVIKTGVMNLPFNYIADTLLNVRKTDIYDKELADYLEKNVPKKIKTKEKSRKIPQKK